MRLPFPALLLACCLSLLAACTTPLLATTAHGVTFVVVRHAEKAGDDPRDPNLSEAGRARAAALAGLLQQRDLVSAYATGFRRTQQTAQPAADAHGITVATYDAALPAAEIAERLRRENAAGTVLVVGHSNTVPQIASALCACEVAPIDEDDYGNLYEIRIDGDGATALSQRRY